MAEPAASLPHVVEETSGIATERRAVDKPMAPGESRETMQIIEERLSVDRVRLKKGSVRVSTRTHLVEEIADITSAFERVEVTHVQIGRVVDVAPQVRSEGNLTIVPVIEERMVLVKQLVLVEEIHLRRHVESEVRRVPIVLRQQHAVVERLDAEGRVIP